MEEQEFFELYGIDHCVCPICGSDKYRCTMVAYIYNENKQHEYKDKNRAVCLSPGCNWRGIVHDLVPRKEF